MSDPLFSKAIRSLPGNTTDRRKRRAEIVDRSRAAICRPGPNHVVAPPERKPNTDFTELYRNEREKFVNPKSPDQVSMLYPMTLSPQEMALHPLQCSREEEKLEAVNIQVALNNAAHQEAADLAMAQIEAANFKAARSWEAENEAANLACIDDYERRLADFRASIPPPEKVISDQYYQHIYGGLYQKPATARIHNRYAYS